MSSIRVVMQFSALDMDQRLGALLDEIQATRSEPGCEQAELFRGIEYPENFAYLQRWEGPQAFDAHWKRGIDAGAADLNMAGLQTPYHYGSRNSPRRQGQNGVEFYPLSPVAIVEGGFSPADEANRIQSVRWPSWGGVRIIFQMASDPGSDPSAAIEDAVKTRREDGCLQFENFRGVEFPENGMLLELWTSADLIDQHWIRRQLQFMEAAASGAPPSFPPPHNRRYGADGFECYQHCYFTQVDHVWEPENPVQRMQAIRW